MDNSDADRMASYIQELLLQDQTKQRATIENLSKYSEEKLGGEAPTPWNPFGAQGAQPMMPCPDGLDIPLPGKLAKSNKIAVNAAAALEADTAAGSTAPLKVDLSQAFVGKAAEQTLGLGQQSSNPQASSAAHQRLQEATQLLQSALANWEACVSQSSSVPPDAVASVEQIVKQLQRDGMENIVAPAAGAAEAAAQDQPLQPPGLSSQALSAETFASASAAAANAGSIGKAANLLEKALFDLNRNLPAQTAQMAHSLLEGVTDTAEGPSNTQEQERLKWLSHYLESQNKVSIERLSKLLQDPAPRLSQAAAFGQGTAAAANHQAWRMPPSSHAALAAAQMSAGRGSSVWANAVHHGLGGIPLAVPAMTGTNAYQAASAMAAAGPKWPWGAGADSEGFHAAAVARGVPEIRKGGGPKKRNTAAQGIEGSIHNVSTPPTDPEYQNTGETLRMHLRSLLHVESSRVLIVRKINRLGFSSPAILKEHFSWYGNVEQVLVAHSRVKSGGGQAGIVSRLRPSGLGFVVMSQTAEAEAIVAQGHQQLVCGTLIRVQKFERRMAEAEDEDAVEDKKEAIAGDSRAIGA